jgi:hypothetical protein
MAQMDRSDHWGDLDYQFPRPGDNLVWERADFANLGVHMDARDDRGG